VLGGGGHWHVGDAEWGERVEDCIHHGWGRGDSAAFADAFGANARALYVTATGRRVVILRVFTKKTQKPPRREIGLARRRAEEVT
jgi:Phage derived protein Gp49-like (DUF891)